MPNIGNTVMKYCSKIKVSDFSNTGEKYFDNSVQTFLMQTKYLCKFQFHFKYFQCKANIFVIVVACCKHFHHKATF